MLTAAAPADFTATNHGTIVMLEPQNQGATDWMTDELEFEGWQWFGNGLAIEPRYAHGLLCVIREHGFTVELI